MTVWFGLVIYLKNKQFFLRLIFNYVCVNVKNHLGLASLPKTARILVIGV